MEREKSVGQFLVERSFLPLGFFFGSFCPKSFFSFFARRLCLFRKFDVFVRVVARRVEKNLGWPTVFNKDRKKCLKRREALNGALELLSSESNTSKAGEEQRQKRRNALSLSLSLLFHRFVVSRNLLDDDDACSFLFAFQRHDDATTTFSVGWNTNDDDTTEEESHSNARKNVKRERERVNQERRLYTRNNTFRSEHKYCCYGYPTVVAPPVGSVGRG